MNDGALEMNERKKETKSKNQMKSSSETRATAEIVVRAPFSVFVRFFCPLLIFPFAPVLFFSEFSSSSDDLMLYKAIIIL